MGRRRSQRASTAWRKAACCDEVSSESSASSASPPGAPFHQSDDAGRIAHPQAHHAGLPLAVDLARPRRRRSSSAMLNPSLVAARKPVGPRSRDPARRSASGNSTPALPSHAAAQLVQLRQAEALGILDDDDRGARHIHAHFQHGGGNQNVELAGTKSRHHLLLIAARHLAVQQTHARCASSDAARESGTAPRHGLPASARRWRDTPRSPARRLPRLP